MNRGGTSVNDIFIWLVLIGYMHVGLYRVIQVHCGDFFFWLRGEQRVSVDIDTVNQK